MNTMNLPPIPSRYLELLPASTTTTMAEMLPIARQIDRLRWEEERETPLLSLDELMRSDDDDDIMVVYENIPSKTYLTVNKDKEVPLDPSPKGTHSSKNVTEKCNIQIREDLFEDRSYNILQNQSNDNGKTGLEDQNSYWKMKYEKLLEERKGFLKSLSELLNCQSCQRRLPFNAERIQCCSNGHLICDTCSTRPSFGFSCGEGSCLLNGSER